MKRTKSEWQNLIDREKVYMVVTVYRLNDSGSINLYIDWYMATDETEAINEMYAHRNLKKEDVYSAMAFSKQNFNAALLRAQKNLYKHTKEETPYRG